MTWVRPLVIALLLAATALAAQHPAAAAAEGPAMTNLQVTGGEDTWHAEEFFRLEWDLAPGQQAQPSGVAYRLYDPAGNQVGPVRSTREHVRSLPGIRVPATPGIYTIEIWLLGPEGEAGPPVTAKLRFDNAPPLPPLPQAPSRWLMGNEPAVVDIAAPPTPHPLSGIGGYEIFLDGEPVDLEVRTDAAGPVSLGLLPEGTTVARVTAVSGAGIASQAAGVAFKVDATAPAVSLHGVPRGWSSGPVRVTARAADALSGMESAGLAGPFTAIAVDGAAPALAWGDEASAWVVGSGVHTVAISARDAAGNVVGGPSAPAASALVRVDEDSPRVAFAAAQDPSEPERIEAIVSDPLSGPSPSRGSIALRPAGTRARFQELPTRVVDERLVAYWDSDAFPHGKYEFLATAFDAAGNAATATQRSRGDRMVLVNPVKAQVLLDSDLRGRRLSGRLRRLGGPPVAGEEVVVTETFAAGAHPRRRSSTVRTGPDGKFSLLLRRGPSRDVAVTYAGNRLLTRAAATSARLSVPTAVRFRASTKAARVGGKPIVFSGRVSAVGARRAARGLPVELQFRYPGAGWSEFRTVETDARGRFRYAYRFSDDDSRGVRFQFRAYVKGREGWPYEPSASRPVKVAGR